MEKKKSPRNKTIDFGEEEGRIYIDRAIAPEDIGEDTVNVTVNGDLFEAAKRMKKKSVDLIVADPPYNLDKNFHGNKFAATGAEEYTAYTEKWLDAVLPLLKDDGSIYVCCDWRSSMVIGNVLAKKLKVLNRITWQREKGRGAERNWKNGMEDIWFATRTDDYTFHVDAVKVRRRVRAPYRADGRPKDWEETPDGKFRNTCPSNFWDDISVPYWSMPENTAHPTQKPEKLLAKLILASSDPGGIVLDPFAGSGSTAVTAKKLGRRFVAIERSEQYCAWAEKRLELAETNPAIQGYADGVFWERNAGRLPR